MEPVALPTEPPEHPVLDHAALVAEGMRQLERLAGSAWTDFNAHDPGITILEAGCYALTDLGYRIFHPIPDLLADGGGAPGAGLFTPAEVLTGRAVTPEDLRRAVLDVLGVKNAWVEPVGQPAPGLRYDAGPKELAIDTGQPATPTTRRVALRGLWRVLVEKSDLEDVDSAALRRAVAWRLHENRNLCEDFEEITLLDPLPVAVRAGVEIGEAESGETVLLGILERVAAQVSPAIRFLTVQEALAAGATVEEIFDGPALQRGFVDPASLAAAERRVALHVSDILREIMAVPGVRAVRRIRLARSGDRAEEAWTLALDPDGAPRLDLEACEIALFRGGAPVAVDQARVVALARARARAARLYRALPEEARDLRLPPGRDRSVAAYAPLQDELPPLYGLGAGTLPESATAERRAQANQLRAFLTLLDQPLANQFAQLAQLRALLSAEGGAGLSHATQLVGEAAGSDEAPVLAPGFDAAALQALVEPPDGEAALRRRNRFLDHMLARFAEAVAGDTPATDGDGPPLAGLIEAKRQFLRAMPWLGGARGTGCNYLSAQGPVSAPALAERIRLKLGLPDEPGLRLLVVEHVLLRPIGEDAANGLPFLAAAAREDPFSLQLSLVVPARLRSLSAQLESLAREETPAHLVAHLLWLEPAPFAAFAKAYEGWLASLRRWWLADRLGTSPEVEDPA